MQGKGGQGRAGQGRAGEAIPPSLLMHGMQYFNYDIFNDVWFIQF